MISSVNYNKNNNNNDIINNIIHHNDDNDNDIENNINTNTNDIKRIDDGSLSDVIKADRNLILFLRLLGFYYNDDKDTIITIILSRIWQFSLLLLGCIGFFWMIFVYGSYQIYLLYNASSSSLGSTDIFKALGLVMDSFIIPILQVTSLIYGIYKVRKQFDQSVDIKLVSKILSRCKRDAIIYFIMMILVVIIIVPIVMNKKYYDNHFGIFYQNTNDKSKFGLQNYSMYVFNISMRFLFLALSITCYLTIVMMFISLTLQQIEVIQSEIIIMLEDDTLTCEQYMIAKNKIIYLRNESNLSTQVLTITAALNIITFMFMIWYNHYHYNLNQYQHSTMILYDFFQLPALLKGMHFSLL